MTSSQANGALSYFATAERIPADAIFALTARYLQDSFPQKVNLGQGAYRDENGAPWVLPSVREARKRLDESGLTHEYLPIRGLANFQQATARLVIGEQDYESIKPKLATCQSLSGTGSLHLAGLLIARCRSPKPKIYLPDPTWMNHGQVFASTGFECHQFRYFDGAAGKMDFSSYLKTLREAEPRSVFVLHACAHNPTGCDPTEAEWREIGQVMKERQLFPVFDAAYLGFNSGSFDKDCFAIRHFINELGLEAAVCISFAKNMGLYGERVGCVLVHTTDSETALNCASVLEQLQRSEVSNPPAYGARVALQILSDPSLKQAWFDDLITMSDRIKSMRQSLYNGLINNSTPGNWDHIIRQSGMFSFLGLSPEVVEELREKHHIYMSSNSRISMAGLNDRNLLYVASAISTCVRMEFANA